MEERNSSEKELSCNVSILTECIDDKTIYLARCEELGMSDFGDSPEEAINNLKIAMSMLIEEDPQKKELLIKDKPLMTTRIILNNI